MRQCAGRKARGGLARGGLATRAVLQDGAGNVATSELEAAGVWQTRFAQEFGGHVVEAAEAELQQYLEVLPPRTCQGQRVSQEEWMGMLCDSLAAAKLGKATADAATVDVMKVAGTDCLWVLAGIAAKAAETRIPMAWRGGVMCPVPRKAKMPMSFGNSRGVMLGSHAAKLVAKAARKELAKVLKDTAGDLQSGSVPGGGTDFPAAAVRMFLRGRKLRCLPAALLFVDVRGAFYSILPELAIGALVGDEERRRLFRQLGPSDEMADKLGKKVAEEAALGRHGGVSGAWRSLVEDWHRCPWYSVRGRPERYRTLVGVRPGDPLADAVFALAFALFQEELVSALAAAGLSVVLRTDSGSIFGAPEPAAREVTMMPPTFVDDLVVPVEAQDCETLVANLAATADLVDRIATQFALEVNFAAGKTEAVMVLAGKAKQAVQSLLQPWEGNEPGEWYALPTLGGRRLRVVNAYKHLGLLAAATRSEEQEIAARARAASRQQAAAQAPANRPMMTDVKDDPTILRKRLVVPKVPQGGPNTGGPPLRRAPPVPHLPPCAPG